MARNPDNAPLWQDARVYVSDAAVRPALPEDVDAPFDPEDWPEVGILDGADGFGEARSSSENKFFGWGIGMIKIGASQFEMTRTMSLLEDNAVTRTIVFPGSTATKIALPKPVYRWLAFETDSDVNTRERLTTTKRARLWVPTNNRTEPDLTKWEVQIGLFADSANDVFDRQAAALTP